MKIWRAYGSEHSMKLVMIGRFKNSADAKKTKELIDELTKELKGKSDVKRPGERFSEAELKILRKAECHILNPRELEDFLLCGDDVRLEDDKISLRTDEVEVSAFLKLMIQKGAKVEAFSAHDYPDEEEESRN